MKFIVLDRDGTINRLRDGFVTHPDEWEALPGALEAIARLNHAGWKVVVASNQPAIGRGLLEMGALNAIHNRMHQALAEVGARVEAVFVCPHVPADGCQCRKPAPGLLTQIGERFSLALAQVPMVGDALADAQAAAAAGCLPHLLLGAAAAERRQWPPDLPPGTRVHTDLAAFARHWLGD